MKNKETLEEAVVKRINNNPLLELHHSTCYSFAKLGAKWQQERSYSEEEVNNLLYLFLEHIGEVQKRTVLNIVPKKWFEQFKKK